VVTRSRCFIIAEAGVNHNGSEELALQLVDAAARTGADAVKFQTFTADALVTRGTAKATYQEANTGAGDQHSMLKQLELPRAAYARLHARAAEHAIEFISTPFDAAAADMLVGLGMRRLKIPSGELTNFPLLEHLAAMGLPTILSTGMATLEEVQEAVAVFQKARRRCGFETAPEALTLLHCTSNYPAALDEVNLRAMHTLRAATGLTVGYSDHTQGTLTAVAAVAAGAVVVEKHFTLDSSLPGPDHRASLEPAMFAEMVRQIRDVEAMLGSGEKTPCPTELPIRALVRRSVTLMRALKAGTPITTEDVVLLRPGTGISPKNLSKVIGKRVARDLPAHTTLQWADLA
jgi:N,N'-diacetyllegionaminate synthase